MTNFEYIKNMNIDELAAWLDVSFRQWCDAPWDEWWNSNYCSKCKAEMVQVVDTKMTIPCGWCEVYGKCKFFQELDSTPDNKQVIKMWLRKEAN